MNKQEAKKRLDAIKREAQELRKMIEGNEYPNGTSGYFTNNEERYKKGDCAFGFLGNTPDPARPFMRYSNPNLSDIGVIYKHFIPIKEAILPPVIEHDGGEYPGDPDDGIQITQRDGKHGFGRAEEFRWTWSGYSTDITGYQIIKRAGK
jgi:hypothetical protein